MSRPSEPSDAQRTMCIVKPSAYAHRDAIEQAVRAHGFVVIARQERTLTKAVVTRLYVQHYGYDYFDALIASMTTGPVCILILSRSIRTSGGSSAVAELRHLVGPSDPIMARAVNPHCLRALYGGTTAIGNGVHASKSPAEAAREEDIFIPTQRRTLILFGPPASGKGTQADLLVSAYGLIHISTGDLLRMHVREGTALGQSIKSYLDTGRLVPDALITHLTLERLNQPDCLKHGWLLDGFPRTPVQAASLIDAGLQVNRLLVLSADRETLVNRVAGRRFDPKTGTTYHVDHNPPPATVVGRLVIRSDDREEVIRGRLATYDATVAGVVRQFHDVVVVQADARAGIDFVFTQIVRALEQEGTRPNVAIRTKSANQKRRLTAAL